jgi:hypothetical protein
MIVAENGLMIHKGYRTHFSYVHHFCNRLIRELGGRTASQRTLQTQHAKPAHLPATVSLDISRWPQDKDKSLIRSSLPDAFQMRTVPHTRRGRGETKKFDVDQAKFIFVDLSLNFFQADPGAPKF